MNRIAKYFLFALLLAVYACSSSHDNISSIADSLCVRLFNERYSDIYKFDSIAKELTVVADGNNELVAVADNAFGYIAMMDMDYSAAARIYSTVIEDSRCEIERLVADVGMMTLCYRTSENRRFFDYRANALSRIKRIDDELALLSPSDKSRYVRARIEFGIVSVCYFSNLSMQEEKMRALEFIAKDVQQSDDPALTLYAEMILANNANDVLESLRRLFIGAATAKKDGYTWLESNYNLLLAISLRDSTRLQMFKEKLPAAYMVLNDNDLPDCDFLLSLASKAVDGFRMFGDRYMMIEAQAVSASCNIEYGRYEDALYIVEEALGEVNKYYMDYYPSCPELCLNSLYAYNEGVYNGSASGNGVYNIAECMLSIRREASCAFAGIGDIEASDINRNAYLELLEVTRLNKHMESRVSLVEESAYEMDLLLLIAFLLFVTAVIYAVIISSRYRRHQLFYSSGLKQLQNACPKLLSSLPREADSKEELCAVISRVLNESMGNLSGETLFSVAVPVPDDAHLPNRYEFHLHYLGGSNDDFLYVASHSPLSPEKYSIVAMLVPYVAVAIEEGLRLANIGDERERVEEVYDAYSIYLTEHKRENLLKRVSVSIVSGMRPYMDRIIGELAVLDTASDAEAQRRLLYIAELTKELDDFNVILERWIKMRQGDMNLQIENFPLSDIFAIILKSRPLLENRGIALNVQPTDCVVKADKALTLFMINTLVDNAAKFTPEGGTVTLESIERDDCVEVAVTDTGIGVSQSDIDRILCEKVYDASTIGKDNELLTAKKKGGGFGLMNCKGIIEKYRKSGELFKVCSLNIESEQGKGSRFSFRLPKGIMRVLLLLLMMFPLSSHASGNILDQVSSYADSVYLCNVNNDYEGAIVHAERAISLLNYYYKENIGGSDTLAISSGAANEIKWWREELFADSLVDGVYYNIMDVRNELAVASLALQQWASYRYNNYVYTTLYRLVHEDKGISERYVEAKAALNYKSAAVAFLMFAILILLLYIAVSYVRHSIIRRNNERMLLKVNERVLQAATGTERTEAQSLLQTIVDEIYESIGENMRMERVAMLLKDSNDSKPVIAVAGDTSIFNSAESIYMLGVVDSGEGFISADGMTHVLPLYVNSADERVLIGAIEFVAIRPLIDDEMLTLELAASYTASVVYHALVRVASSYEALDEIEEMAQRVRFEENRVHVQNMVLDNCLSVLKHETIYYPSRIRDIAERTAVANEKKQDAVATMRELMDYYSAIFGILSNCARKELDDRCFTVSKVALHQLFEDTARYVERMRKRSAVDISFSFEPTSACVSVDKDLIGFLLESLINAAFMINVNGTLLMRAIDSVDEVKVELVDNRYELTSEAAAELFVPSRRNIADDGSVVNMEYLIIKEILRLHEDNTGRRGSRVEARSDANGTIILFTLPK
ncbi:MAG: DUF5113 domain-containing protein [Bacteroidaceae bacterium]|nr:DUF5113 domain-containing protein [Bacteroidaceae bacterium]